MKPLILDFKETRTEMGQSKAYEYDIHSGLNIVLINGEKKPFIDIEKTDLQLLTKTKVRQESDDNSFLLELATKTLVSRERDDT